MLLAAMCDDFCRRRESESFIELSEYPLIQGGDSVMHVCLFDIDGTLLDTGGAGQAAMEAAIRSEFGTQQTVEGIWTAGRTDRAIMVDLFEYFGVAFDEQACRQFQAAYFEHLPEHLSRCSGLALPGVPELLETLSGRDDVVLGLLTGNFRHGAQLKLGHHGLFDYFEFGGFGDHHLDRDDVAREALAQVHERMDGTLDIGRVWVIGDTPADIRCARAIGANAVAVSTGIYPAEELAAGSPDHLFDSFLDHRPLLALLGAS